MGVLHRGHCSCKAFALHCTPLQLLAYSCRQGLSTGGIAAVRPLHSTCTPRSCAPCGPDRQHSSSSRTASSHRPRLRTRQGVSTRCSCSRGHRTEGLSRGVGRRGQRGLIRAGWGRAPLQRVGLEHEAGDKARVVVAGVPGILRARHSTGGGVGWGVSQKRPRTVVVVGTSRPPPDERLQRRGAPPPCRL